MYCELTFYVQGLYALKESLLIALAQILLQTLDVFSKKYLEGSVADSLNARVFSPDSPLQLTTLRVILLSLSGCSSPGHRHVDICFCLASPIHPRPGSLCSRGGPTRPAVCSMYGCCKGSLHILNTAAAWGYRFVLFGFVSLEIYVFLPDGVFLSCDRGLDF